MNNKFVQVSILSFDEEVWYWNNCTINKQYWLSMPCTHTCWTCPRPGRMAESPRARRAPSSRPRGCPSRPWRCRDLLGLPSGSWAVRWRTELLLLLSTEHSCRPHGTAGCCVAGNARTIPQQYVRHYFSHYWSILGHFYPISPKIFAIVQIFPILHLRDTTGNVRLGK